MQLLNEVLTAVFLLTATFSVVYVTRKIAVTLTVDRITDVPDGDREPWRESLADDA